MHIDLVVSRKGDVMLLCEGGFPAAVTRVEYYRDTRLMVIMYDEDGSDGHMLEREVPETMINAVRRAPIILVTCVEDGEIQDGFNVPLIQIGL